MFMSSDSIHDAVLCAERRGRTPARSINAALLARSYSRKCDYLIIKCSLFSVALMPGVRSRSAFFLRPCTFYIPCFSDKTNRSSGRDFLGGTEALPRSAKSYVQSPKCDD
jgi:hypothetical protein